MLKTGNGFYLVMLAGGAINLSIGAFGEVRIVAGVVGIVSSIVLIAVAHKRSESAAEYNYKAGELDGFEKGRNATWEYVKRVKKAGRV